MPRLYRTTLVEILDNEKLNANCSERAVALFKDLFLLADDHGRLSGSAQLVRSRVFAFKPDVTVEMVEAALTELWQVNCIRFYEFKKRRYIEITGWAEHQRIQHPSKPIAPVPTDDAEYVAPHFAQESLLDSPAQSQNGLASRESLETLTTEGKGREGKGRELTPSRHDFSSRESHETSEGEGGKVDDPPSSKPKAKRKPKAKAFDPSQSSDEVKTLIRAMVETVTANGFEAYDDDVGGGPDSKTWHDEARRLLEAGAPGGAKEPVTLDQALWMVRWTGRHEFWHRNIRSVPKLRKKWRDLVAQAKAEAGRTQAKPAARGRTAETDERTRRRLAGAQALIGGGPS